MSVKSPRGAKGGARFRVKFWGVRGSYPTVDPNTLYFGGNTSCVEAEVDGRRLIFDAGTGIIPLGKELCNGVPPTPAAYVFLSHTHIDHVMGLCFFEPLLTPEEVQALAQRSEDITTGVLNTLPIENFSFERRLKEQGINPDDLTGEDRYNAVRLIRYLHQHDDLVRAICQKAAILDVLQDLLGPNLKLYTDQFFMKPPFDGGAQGWHQDSGTWTFFLPHDHVTVWIALDEATEDNGCLAYIPGSHKLGYVDAPHLANLVDQLKDQTVLVPRKPGYAALHHSLTLHYTGPNKTPNRRRGLALHYMRAETRYIGNPDDRQPPFMLVRGQEFAGRV